MFDEFYRWVDGLFNPGTELIRVAKPWCTPARPVALSALQPYHVAILSFDERIVRDLDGNNLFIEASIRVKREQAEWAEYLLLRTNRFQLVSRPINPKNKRWAARYAGRMPTPWDIATGRAQPWREPGCMAATCKATKQRRGRKPRKNRKG